MIISHLVFLFFVQLHDEIESSFPCGTELESHRNYRLLKNDRCGRKPPIFRLPGYRYVGCRFAHVGEFPWMAMILAFDYGKYDFRCAGAIINEKYILTAARCMKYTENNRTFVRVGNIHSGFDEHPVETSCFTRTIGVEKVIRHERFHKKSIYDDIALVRLKEKIHFYAYELPICLPFSCDLVNKNFEGTRLMVSGWGRIEDLHIESRVVGPQLKVELLGMRRDDCSKHWEHYVEEERELFDICMWGIKPGVDGLRGIFFGNPGTPLMYSDGTERYYAIGLGALPKTQLYPPPTEIGNGDYKKFPPRYTRVAAYMSWILDNIEP